MRFLLAFFLVFHGALAAFGAEVLPAGAAGAIVVDTSWKGEVSLAGPVSVAEGVTLSIEPGTRVLCSPEGLIEVRGRLLVKGTADKPVEFVPRQPAETPSWGGILVVQPSAPGEVRFARISGAKLEVAEGSLLVADTVLENSEVGLSFVNGGRSKVLRCRFSDIKGVGLLVSRGSVVEIEDCRFERCRGMGVEISQQAGARVAASRFTDSANGVLVSGARALVERNQFEKTGTALTVTQAGESVDLLDNRIEGNETGIVCRQFAFPKITGNRVRDNREGLVCVTSSNPEITQNLFENNQQALGCSQLSSPRITKNVFTGNQTAIYLHLSSYPAIRDNNFSKNGLHLVLDTMSADWENRAGNKGKRGLAARNQSMVEQGKAMPEETPEFKPQKDFVEAEGNWWGPETTKEMTAKGPDADISTFRDYYDEPKRTYEGFEGEYVQDRVRYTGWRTTPVADAGPQADSAGAKKAEPPPGKALPRKGAEEKGK